MSAAQAIFGVAVFIKAILYAGLVVLGYFMKQELIAMIAGGALLLVSVIELLTLLSNSPIASGFSILLVTLEAVLLAAALGYLVYLIIELPTWWKEWLDERFTEIWNVNKLENHQDITYYLGAVALALLILALLALIAIIIVFIQARRQLHRTLPIQIEAEFAHMPYTTLDVEGPENVKLYNVKL
ncbi:unnamed protein product [Bursaphelenchus xylophilus]|uniref:(pine wood nematode) hypothetical protein n=1 Tax=Bursaphelenchus xylophilus TaxID=6326 RepID=A0A1I7RK80_BURXY|nr:unnamed protein product [Bursaphelenchus xylophilus]CAG9131437.1 unnamed protein product [Bursaphelenchus xylophilus]